MGQTKILLHREDYESILAEARLRAPEEACGLIGGTVAPDGTVEITAVRITENTDHTDEHFTIAPADQLAAVRDFRAAGIRPLGNWHSHPASPSRQSAEDIRIARDRHAHYLIISLEDPAHPVINSFHTEGTVSTKEDLQIV